MNEVPVVASAEDLAALEAIGREQEQKQAAATPEEKPVTESSASSNEDEQPESDTGKEQEQNAEDFTAKGLRKRFHKLTSENRELRQAVEQLLTKANQGVADPKGEQKEQQAAVSGKPDPAKYEFGQFDPAYVEDLTDWKFEQREQAKVKAEADRKSKEQQSSLQKQQAEWLAKGSQEFEDFEEVFENVPGNPVVMAYLLRSDIGQKLAHHLGQNKAEAQRIAAMEPIEAVEALAELKFKLKTPEQPEKRVATKAPPPPANVGGRGGGKAFDPMDPATTYKEYERWANEQARRR